MAVKNSLKVLNTIAELIDVDKYYNIRFGQGELTFQGWAKAGTAKEIQSGIPEVVLEFDNGSIELTKQWNPDLLVRFILTLEN